MRRQFASDDAQLSVLIAGEGPKLIFSDDFSVNGYLGAPWVYISGVGGWFCQGNTLQVTGGQGVYLVDGAVARCRDGAIEAYIHLPQDKDARFYYRYASAADEYYADVYPTGSNTRFRLTYNGAPFATYNAPEGGAYSGLVHVEFSGDAHRLYLDGVLVLEETAGAGAEGGGQAGLGTFYGGYGVEHFKLFSYDGGGSSGAGIDNPMVP